MKSPEKSNATPRETATEPTSDRLSETTRGRLFAARATLMRKPTIRYTPKSRKAVRAIRFGVTWG